ncbi:hypothetical protein LN42_06440 [Marinitoga sp. 1137]|uniref:P-loop NTPase fold protein n=1 Tax=Marinitoga sp. 1137 TaxID=1545835 RepID=UPI0009508AE7|nr:P-loop NTPase fold protein [Marinitoga sp. 1137]APT76058.1 hypothetical protein LN42_06440 [Marinitoga sp. 1137]
MEDDKIKYIPDKEINLENRDLLGTKIYVDILSEIIETADTPFTIGLFGSWGVGKSSIIKTLQEKFEKDKNSEISIFIYDAWKYSNDSFRRTFLLELKEYFQLESTEKFDSFYEDKHEDIDHKLEIKKNSWLWWLAFSPLLLILIWFFPTTTDLKITTSIISLIITMLSILLKETFVQYKITISKPKLFAPEQFEAVFDEIIDKLIDNRRNWYEWIKGILNKDKKKISKIVIVIDNIDRCHKDLTFELLLTIKNFLEKKGVIFIIPIDDKELKKHIQKQGHDPNEFLRKIFNTTIPIKEISEGDLFDFAKKLNGDYELNFPIEVISIIAQQFSKNPRKIIHIFNILQTEICLAKYQEENKHIPQGTIISNENLPFLTKLLIIREEWPDLYEVIKNNSYLLMDLMSEVKKKNENFYLDKCKLNEQQINFLRRTNHIKPTHSNFELFFVNKDQFKDVPDKIITLVESNGLNGMKELMKNKEITFDKLIEFIDYRFELGIKRGEINTTIINLVALIINMALDNEIKENIRDYLYSKSTFLGNFKDFIKEISVKNCRNIFSLIEVESVLIFIKENEELSHGLLDSIIKIINEETDSKELIQDFVKIFKEDSQKLKTISTKFSNLVASDNEFLKEMILLLTNNDIAIKSLITSDLVDKFIEQVTNSINDDNSISKLKLIIEYNSINGLSNDQMTKLIQKLIQFINSTNDFAQLAFWLEKLNKFIPYIKNMNLINNTVVSSLSTKQNLLWQHYSSQWKNKLYQDTLYNFLLTLKELYYIINDNNKKNQLIAWLNQYYSKNELPDLIKFINNLFYEMVEKSSVYNWHFSQYVINRFGQIEDWEIKEDIAKIINLMLHKTEKINNRFNGLNKNQIQTIFKLYINTIKNNNREEIIKWIVESVEKNSALVELFEEVNASLINSENLIIITKILKELNNKNLASNIIAKIVLNIDCEEAYNAFEYLSNEEKDIFEEAIYQIIKNIENSQEYFKCLIEKISNYEFLNKDIYDLIAERIKPLLVSSNAEDILFAFKVLDSLKIDKITKTKLEAIKVLIQDIDEKKFQGDEAGLIKKVKNNLIYLE